MECFNLFTSSITLPRDKLWPLTGKQNSFFRNLKFFKQLKHEAIKS